MDYDKIWDLPRGCQRQITGGLVSSALALRQNFTPAQLGMLIKLCNDFRKRRPPKPSLIPTWDTELVLRAFSLVPFEPLETTTWEAMHTRCLY